MWPDGNPGQARTSTGSEVVLDERVLGHLASSKETPTVSNLNVTKSSRVHIGPKFLNITQNVHNTEVVKGGFLGLELVSPSRAGRMRMRCSVAVFVCWALIVASGLAFYLFSIALPTHHTRLDIGLKEPWYLRRGDWQAMPPYGIEWIKLPIKYILVCHSASAFCDEKYECIKNVLGIQQDHLKRGFGDIGSNYLIAGNGILFEGRGANVVGAMVRSWNRVGLSVTFIGDYRKDSPDLSLGQYLGAVIKNTSRAERLFCGAAMLLVVACTVLIAYYTTAGQGADSDVDIAPHEWNISRAMWLAQPYNNTRTPAEYSPLRLVIIQHSVSQECARFVACAAELRNLQTYFITYSDYDIPYNFLVGNDGRVYEGRGWCAEGAHTRGFNRCAVGIGFIGDYREDQAAYSRVTESQVNRTLMLLEGGVRMGFLHPQYLVVGAKDLQTSSESPGSNLYKAIQQWDHYDHSHRFRNMTCDEINAVAMGP